MQQQSMQYHIDAIRNILSLKPRATKHPHRHLVYLDHHESIKKNINPKKQQNNTSKKYHHADIIIIYIFIFNMCASLFTENNPITILYIPACLYILWTNYSCIYTNSPQQKIQLSTYITCMTIPLGITMMAESSNNPQTQTFHLSTIYFYFIVITGIINICTIIQAIITMNISNNIAFITSNVFVQHENTSTTSARTLANEHIQHMIHQSGDIIVVGQKSPMHAILTERCKKFPHNRTILEQHLYHLSCQVPLIYLTPNGNYIPKTT